MYIAMEEFSIGEVAKQTGVTQYTLRYYEDEGLISPVRRAPNGHRRYIVQDVQRIVFVTRLRASGMPIADIKRYVDLVRRGDATIQDRLALLESHRRNVQLRLEEIGQYLKMIESKIESYHRSNRLMEIDRGSLKR